MFRRIVNALTVNAFGQISTVLIQLASVPLLIGSWGAVYYGEWLLLVTLPAYLGLADGGVVSALTNELAISVAQRDMDKATRQLSNGLFVVSGISLLCAGLLMAGLAVWPYRAFLHISQVSVTDSSTVLGWLLLYGLASLQTELLSGIYQANQRYALGRWWITWTKLLEFGAMAGVVWLSGKAPDVAAAYGMVRSVALLLMWLDCRYRFGWVGHISSRYVSRAQIRPLLSPSASFLAFAAGHALVLQGSLLLIGALLSPVQVVVYNTLRTLTNALRQLTGIINASFWPELTIAIAQRQFGRAAQLHRVAVQTAFWLCLLGGITLELTGAPLLTGWTTGRMAPAQPLFTWLLISALTYSVWNASATTAIATNRHQTVAIAYVLGNCLAIGCGFITVPYSGPSGLVMGFIGVDLILIGYVFRRSVALLQVERMAGLMQSVFTDFRWVKRLKRM